MYVLQRTDQGGGYVAQPGSHSSYTKDLRRAQTFATEEAADRDRCVGNEVIVEVSTLLRRPVR